MGPARTRAPGPRNTGVVTSLAAVPGRADRIAVRIDGLKAFDLATVLVDQAGLRVGDVLSEDVQVALIAKDAPFRARERALRLLASRDRSRGEVEVRLRTAGFAPEIVTDTVAWLLGLGYLDDGRFAARYCAEKQRNGWGPRRIRAELIRKGVERTLVDEALSSADDGSETAEGLEAVTALARRRFGEQYRRDPVAAGRRLAGFLARRGYDWETIAAVVRVLAAEAGGGDRAFEAEEPGD